VLSSRATGWETRDTALIDVDAPILTLRLPVGSRHVAGILRILGSSSKLNRAHPQLHCLSMPSCGSDAINLLCHSNTRIRNLQAFFFRIWRIVKVLLKLPFAFTTKTINTMRIYSHESVCMHTFLDRPDKENGVKESHGD